MNPSRSPLLPAAAVLWLAGCTGELRVDARIVDDRGKPVPGAQLRLYRDGFDWAYTRLAAQDGCLSAGGTVSPGADRWNAAVSADGYKPVLVQVESPRHHALLITLSRLSIPSSSSAAAVGDLKCAKRPQPE